MSRIYFHSPHGEAELDGSEHAWLNHIAVGAAKHAWDLDNSHALERAVQIVSLVPEVPDGQYGANYLHTYMRDALAERDQNDEHYKRTGNIRGEYAMERRFVNALRDRLYRLDFDIAGVTLHSTNIELNTALVAGSDPIRLAAKLYGWAAVHTWVDGPDRAWLAGIIEQGLETRLYRRGVWAEDPGGSGHRWYEQGWEKVLELLRARDDEPVVTSHSVYDGFPDISIASMLPPWPEGVPESHDNITDAHQAKIDAAYAAWYELTDDAKWTISMAGLKQRRPWAQLTPTSLAGQSFGPMVTVYDLFADDRHDRVRAAVAALDETR